ncbi:MAG: extracellular solute-binding protein [Caldilineaceae bacterium]
MDLQRQTTYAGKVKYIFCGVVLFLLAACGSQLTPEPTPAPPRQLRVVLFASFSATADAAMQDLVQQWGEQHQVEVQILNTMPVNPDDSLASGQFPDCGMIGELNEWIVNGVLVETTDLIAELDAAEGGYLENSLLPSRIEGKQWAIPFALVNSVFFVRQDKLTAAGLPLPTTWEDVRLAAEAITIPDQFWGWGMQIGPSGDTETAFRTKLWSYGGSVWDAEGKPAIDSVATRQVLEFMQAAWLAGLMPPDAPTWDDSSNNDAYMSGTVGMVLNAGSLLDRLQAEDPALLANTAVLPAPAGPAGRFAPGDIRHWAIFKTENADLCLQLTAWLLAPTQMRSFYSAGSGYFLPVHRNLLNDPMWQEPYQKVLAEQAPNTVVTGYPGPITPWAMEARSNGILSAMIRQVLVDGRDIDAAIAEADAALWQLYDSWQARRAVSQ